MNIPSEPLIDFSKLEALLQTFANARDWQKFHTPKNLILALTGEMGELAEIFQWLTDDESRLVSSNQQTAEAVRDELADVLIYLVRLSSVLGVNLNDATEAKLVKNAQKYPLSLNIVQKTD